LLLCNHWHFWLKVYPLEAFPSEFVTVITLWPLFSSLQAFLVTLAFVYALLPVSRPDMTVIFALTPLTLTTALELKPVPITSSSGNPDADVVSVAFVIVGLLGCGAGVGGALHLIVTRIPCWLPTNPAGHDDPAGKVVRFWLVPFGPLTNTTNV